MGKMLACPKCNREAEEGQKFCAYCGAKIEEVKPQEQTLRSYLAMNGKMTIENTLFLLEPAILKLEQLHQQGGVYGSLNPDNVLITNEGATILRDTQSIPAEYAMELSYTALEKLNDNVPTQGEDVYSLCATIYKCVTGVDPVDAQHRIGVDPLVFGTEWSAYYKQVLTVGLNVQENGRFKAVGALKTALYRNLKQNENKVTAKTVAVPPPTPTPTPVPVSIPVPAPVPTSKPATGFSQDDDKTVILPQEIQGKANPLPSNNYKPITPQPTVKKETANKKTKKKGNGTGLIIALTVVIAIIVIGTVLFLFLTLKSGKKLSDFLPKKESVETSATEENTEGKMAAGDAEALITEADALVEGAINKLTVDQMIVEAQGDLVQAIDKYIQAGAAGDEMKEKAQAGITKAAGKYEEAILMQMDLLFVQDPQKEIYDQIITVLNTALGERDTIAEAGYEITMDKVQATKDDSEERYKKIYIDLFDGYMEEYNWNVRHNEEVMRAAKEAFPSDDVDDAIALRYAYAKAWLVHQEVVEGIGDGSLDAAGAVEKIKAALPETDYCEFLVREAENYAMQSGNYNQAYFSNVSSPVLADSSSKEYTAEELNQLSAAQLHAARVEIYDRHGMTNETMYKFMSYNDFGIYKADSNNGLTTTERHNIRLMVQVAMQNGKFMK